MPKNMVILRVIDGCEKQVGKWSWSTEQNCWTGDQDEKIRRLRGEQLRPMLWMMVIPKGENKYNEEEAMMS